MRVLILSARDDTGGVAGSLARALRVHQGIEALEVHRTGNYIVYPGDVTWPLDAIMPEQVAEAFVAADVLHVMESWQAAMPFDGWQRKPLVIHHHGSQFRQNHAALVRSTAELGAVSLVSTLDLTLLDPDAEWLPNPIDVDRMLTIRATEWPDPAHAGFTIAHSPTNRATKGTDAFVAAAAAAEVHTDIIERETWATSLIRKARADAFYDQVRSGYGLAGLEAMAMGIPVIAGAKDPTLMALGVPGGAHLVELFARRFGYLPWLNADEGTLERRIREIRDDDTLRDHLTLIGEYHARRWHGEARVAAQLVRVYERAIAKRASA